VRGDEARAYLRGLLLSDLAVIDTETTGIGRRDEVIEVGVIDGGGRTLFESLIRPRSGFVPAAASAVHGLSMRDLRDAPSFADVAAELSAVLGPRRVIAWNAPFDQRLLAQSAEVWGVPAGWGAFECAMRAYARATTGGGRGVRLAQAAAATGVLSAAQSHRSVDDCQLTLRVLLRTASRLSLAAGSPPRG
jgi:DNA polymerase III subunit epsilon